MALLTQHSDCPASEPFVWLEHEGDDQQLCAAINALTLKGAASIMILACADNQHNAHNLQSCLSQCPVPVFGGIFPAIFYAEQYLQRGILLLGFPFSIQVDIYKNISSEAFDIEKPNQQYGQPLPHSADSIILIDGVATTIERFIHQVYETIGGGNRVVGGGAGFPDFIQRPCLFTSDGIMQDAALIIKLPVVMNNAARHGWETMDGPYLVTEATETEIQTIDYLPAFEIYKENIEQQSLYRFDVSDFFTIAQNYPLGIVSINDDIMVRDPVRTSDNKLICIGNVPVNSMIYILQGDKSTLLQAAYQASEQVNKSLTTQSLGITMIFDCISRALYLAEDFTEELSAITQGSPNNTHLVGALSIGEITNTSTGAINLLNKSIVVAQL